MKISVPSPVFFAEKHYEESETLQIIHARIMGMSTRGCVNKGIRFASGTIKSAILIL